jgi:hypothetical protein
VRAAQIVAWIEILLVTVAAVVGAIVLVAMD